MKNNYLILIRFFFVFVLLSACGNNNNSKTFNTVKIGDQVWMTENLDVRTFRNGDSIPEAKNTEEWVKAVEGGTPAWCYYDNDTVNGEKYGKLYNWYAVTDLRGIAHKGWHIPTDIEWTMLTDSLGGEQEAGTKMKANSGWIDNGNGINESGFTALPGGWRLIFGGFSDIGLIGKWWSSTEEDAESAWSRNMYSQGSIVERSFPYKGNGFSVRCIKD